MDLSCGQVGGRQFPSGGSCTSNECLSDVSSGEEWGDGAGARKGEGKACKVARRSPRQYSFLPVEDMGSARDTDRDRDRDSRSSSGCSSALASRLLLSRDTADAMSRRGDSAMDEELASAMTRGCLMKERLSITIPKSEYFIFPSDLPKPVIVECVQSLFDAISAVLPSRYDKDKHSWSVYSSIPSLATRFKIHIYDFDGITHIEMRAESGCEKHGRLVFQMLQAAVGRTPPVEDGQPADIDYYLAILCGCVPHSERMEERDLKRNMKSINRAIQVGSAVELETACVSVLQASVFEEMFSVLVECVQPLLDRILTDDITKKISEPSASVANLIPGEKLKTLLKSGRQKCYSVVPNSEWNAYVRASDVLRRLSVTTECQDFILGNSCIVTYFSNFITASVNDHKVFLLRRNIAKVLDNLTASKPYEVLMCGLTETVCLSWLSAVNGHCAYSDPQFIECVRNTMQNLGFSLSRK
jgi:hypothetical protein